MTARSAIKRVEILDTAAELFARRGYRGTNMKLLAQRAQASTSTIYSYFHDKGDLLQQAVEQRLDALEAALVARQAQIDDPVEALLQGIELLNETVANDPLLCALLTFDGQLAGLKRSAHARRVAQRIDAHGVALVEQASRSGALDVEDPGPFVATLRLAFQGWLLNRAHGEADMSEAVLTRTVKRIVLGMIRDE